MEQPNLLIRSSYTFFQSLLKIDDIISNAIFNKYTYVSIVDTNIMYGAYELYEKAIKNNLKPIIGLDIKYQNINKIFIAKNEKGYKSLLKISSIINMNQNLELKDDENLIEIKKDLLNFHCLKEKNDFQTLELFASINKIKILEKPLHLLNKDEIDEFLTSEQKTYIKKIVSEVNINIESLKLNLPKFISNDKKIINSSEEFLLKTLKLKLDFFLKENKKISNLLEYEKRMFHEYEVIKKMGFCDYFLIVSDFVNWAKTNNILIGPGRGSAPGSLISFLLGITMIDPIKNHLFFERFLNVNRISMPDIDVDVQDDKRDLVLNYILLKYGIDHVAQIITFQTLRAKMSLKDVARVMEVPVKIVEDLSNITPEFETLENSYKTNKKFREKIENNITLKKIYNSAKLIEGLPRQFSTHAAGIVLSTENISSIVPIQKGFNKIVQTQYSMNIIESIGLLKIDVLGLRNLTFTEDILEKIKTRHKINIDLNKIDFEDKTVFKILSEGLTKGIFQLESPGMTKSLEELKVDSFEDIVAMTSLFRPGPLKNIKNYILRKHGKEKITYFDPLLKQTLESTYGIIVYQEQIMEIVKLFSGFSLEKADLLRRAISKKNTSEINNLKKDFLEGASKLKRDSSKAIEIFSLIYEFSDYGFNRSHAFAYSIISFQLAYLKVKYSLEFFTALLSSTSGNREKTFAYLEEATEFKIKILKPSINYSSSEFIIENNSIRIGFFSIKGIGNSIVSEILTERKKGIFLDYIDFVTRISLYKIGKGTIELLIKSGCLDEFELNKTTMLNNLENILSYAQQITSKESDIKKISEDLIKLILKPKIELFKKDNEENMEIETLGFDFKNLEKGNLKPSKNIDDSKEIKGKILFIRTLKTKTGLEMAFVTLEVNNFKMPLTLWPGVLQKYKSLLINGKEIIVKGKKDVNQKSLIVSSIVGA